ncbi:NEDD4-binding protein 2-like 1 [Sardina pilchardus]|uniref:NEDD4-binding protein 2-like 1 n=1 Tax=Sardina pilchardus TaxID=27697 RepID=UPI002E102210
MMEQIRRNRGTMYILRGLPGTGRSREAQRLLQQNGGAIIKATDYFRIYHGTEDFIPEYAEDSHEWARKQAMNCVERLEDPIIINNPNMPRWHMYPYVAMAYSRGYWIEFYLTPDSLHVPLEELEWRCEGRVPLAALKDMRDSYEPIGRHPYDVLHDEYSQKTWIGDPEMISNNWWPNAEFLWPDLYQRRVTWEITYNNWWPNAAFHYVANRPSLLASRRKRWLKKISAAGVGCHGSPQVYFPLQTCPLTVNHLYSTF